jgi:hypothetical protein
MLSVKLWSMCCCTQKCIHCLQINLFFYCIAV